MKHYTPHLLLAIGLATPALLWSAPTESVARNPSTKIVTDYRTAGVVHHRPDLTALTGGAATALDSVVTAGMPRTGLPVNTVYALVIDGAEQTWRLQAGTTAEDGTTYVRPDDYNASTNPRVWVNVTPAGGGGGGLTTEQAQDAIGSILDDGTTGTITFTYDDATPKISAVVEDDGVALGTKTTGNYAAGDGEAGNASTVVVVDGTDTTSFVAIFDSATGGLAAKTDGGLLYDASTGTLAPTILSTATVTLTSTGTLNGLDAIDATGETTLEAALDIAGEVTSTGLGSTVIADSVTVTGWELGASTATTPAENDNDTSIATTAYVQTEISGLSGGGGDAISVDSSAVVDPDFVSTGDIDFVNTSNTITANINANSVALGTDTTGNYAAGDGEAGNASTVVVVDGTDATSFVAIFDSATGGLAAKTDGGLLYAADTGTLSPTVLSTATVTLTGTGTLNGLDAIDATGETTLEAAIDIAGEVTGTGLGSVAIADSVSVATWTMTGSPGLTLSNGATSAGVLQISEDSDNGSNYTRFTIGTQSADITYTLPTDDGDAGEQLQTKGSGVLSWEAAGSGSGAPTDADYLVGTANGSLSAEIVVGTSPGGELGNTWASPTIDDSLTVDSWTLTNATISSGTADVTTATVGSIVFEGATADAYETTITVEDPAASDKTVTFRNATGTVLISGDTITGDVSLTFDTDGSSAATIAANSVALGTDTTGNYAAGDGEAGNASTVVVVDGTDATSFVAIFDSATGGLAAKTDGGLLYAADTGTLSPTVLSTATVTLTGTGTLNGLDAIDGTGETTLESALDIAGEVTGTGLGSVAIADSVTVTGWELGASTATTASAGDSDTSLATTSFVQTELDATFSGSLASPSTGTQSPTWSGPIRFFIVGGTATVNLPAAASYTGRAISFYFMGSYVITAEPNSSEIIYRAGTAQTGGVNMTITGTIGQMCTMLSDGTSWVTLPTSATLAVGT